MNLKHCQQPNHFAFLGQDDVNLANWWTYGLKRRANSGSYWKKTATWYKLFEEPLGPRGSPVRFRHCAATVFGGHEDTAKSDRQLSIIFRAKGRKFMKILSFLRGNLPYVTSQTEQSIGSTRPRSCLLLLGFAISFQLACQEREETPNPENANSTPNETLNADSPFPALGSQEDGPIGDPWIPLKEGMKSDSRKPLGLLLATVDPLTMPWKASVYAVNTESYSGEKVLTGESGDPIFRPVKDEIWMFNRSADSQNFRKIAKPLSSQPSEKNLGSQQKFIGGEVGDPHDVLRLGSHLLMAHYNEGKLVLMDTSSHQELGRIEAEWDLPEGVKLKPSSLVLTYKHDTMKSFVYVIHQALSIKSGVYGVNNTQQVFVLAYDPKNPTTPLVPVDLDPNQPKIQGIKLKGSFPIPVKLFAQKKLLLVSMCSRFSLMTPPTDSSPTCQGAVEEINLSDHSSQTLWDMNTLNPMYYMNGGVIAGDLDLSFFAQVEKQDTPGKFTQYVARFDIATKTVTEIYTYRPLSGGFWATFFDPSSQRLYVGDIGKDSAVGHLLVLNPKAPGQVLKEIVLDGVPYSGAWVYP